MFGRSLKKTALLRGLPGVGFQHTADGQYDMQHRRLCNANDPIDNADLVTLSFMKKIINSEIELIQSKKLASKDLEEIKKSIEYNHFLIMKLMKSFSQSVDFEIINTEAKYQRK